MACFLCSTKSHCSFKLILNILRKLYRVPVLSVRVDDLFHVSTWPDVTPPSRYLIIVSLFSPCFDHSFLSLPFSYTLCYFFFPVLLLSCVRPFQMFSLMSPILLNNFCLVLSTLVLVLFLIIVFILPLFQPCSQFLVLCFPEARHQSPVPLASVSSSLLCPVGPLPVDYPSPVDQVPPQGSLQRVKSSPKDYLPPSWSPSTVFGFK